MDGVISNGFPITIQIGTLLALFGFIWYTAIKVNKVKESSDKVEPLEERVSQVEKTNGAIETLTTTVKKLEDITESQGKAQRKIFAMLEQEEQKRQNDEERNEIIMRALYGVLISLQKGATNGEVSKSLQELNNYFISKSSK